MTERVWLKLSEVVGIFREHGLPHDRRTIVGMIADGTLVGKRMPFLWMIDKESVERMIDG